MKEKWEEFYSKNDLIKLQNILKNTLSVFIEICKKLDIEYIVYGGTLLGVEKYSDIIPWDDDIDVALPRDSYNKFIQNANKVLPKDYFIQEPYTDNNTPYPYVKLRKKGTKFIEYINRNINMETGIYIDIYPIDKIPDDEELRLKQFKKVRKWIFIYVLRQSRLYDKKEYGLFGICKKIMKWIISMFAKVFTRKHCLKKIDYYMTLYNNSQTCRYAALNSPNYNNIYNHLYPFEKGKFGDILVNLPGDYKTHLTMRYGNYNEELPKNQRYGHVPYIFELRDSDD